jgi:tRNA 2-thiouridine synthesizing protein A
MTEIFLDCEGLRCPLPVLRTRKRLQNMAPGTILAVAASDPMAAIDLPHFCREAGHDFLSAQETGPVTIYRIRRGASSAPQ